MQANDFAEGERVQMHPVTDSWMRGDRCGTVMSLGVSFLMVRLDKSGKTVRVSPDDITHLTP